MDHERAELALDLRQIRRALDELAAPAGTPESRAGVARLASEALHRIERQSKTQRLDFASFLEMASRINAQGLDLDRLDSYVTTLLRGRTGAASVSLLRETDEEGILNATRGPTRTLELASPLAQRLTTLERPLDLTDTPEPQFADAALLAPLIQHDGGERSLRGVLVLGKKMTGQPYGARDLEFLGLISELLAIALHNAFLHHAATHDALTETWSRGYFDVELKREVSRAQRRRARATAATFSLVMLDIDHFKRVNDTFGHRAGDRVLRAVSATLRRTIRDYDTLARWGGEEFAIILPDVSKHGAIDAAERYRFAVRTTPITPDEGAGALPKITASFGVASFPEDAEDPRELLRKADAALYQSKESGRDRVTAAS